MIYQILFIITSLTFLVFLEIYNLPILLSSTGINSINSSLRSYPWQALAIEVGKIEFDKEQFL